MRRHNARPTAHEDFSIKPQDLGFYIETATEIAPTPREITKGASNTKVNPGNLRPNLGIYPGE